MATIISTEKMTALLKRVTEDRRKSRGETYFFYHQGVKDFAWGNNDELREQMKIWRKQRKDGLIEMLECNNHTKKINGTDWHILVLQPTCEKHMTIDPTGFGLDEQFIVSGFIYYFKRIENRYATYKYVMGLS
jgi:hypothetical protein